MHEQWPVKDGVWNYVGKYTGTLGGCEHFILFWNLKDTLFVHGMHILATKKDKCVLDMESNVYESSNK